MSLVFFKIHINTESDFTELPKIHFFSKNEKNHDCLPVQNIIAVFLISYCSYTMFLLFSPSMIKGKASDMN